MIKRNRANVVREGDGCGGGGGRGERRKTVGNERKGN